MPTSTRPSSRIGPPGRRTGRPESTPLSRGSCGAPSRPRRRRALLALHIRPGDGRPAPSHRGPRSCRSTATTRDVDRLATGPGASKGRATPRKKRRDRMSLRTRDLRILVASSASGPAAPAPRSRCGASPGEGDAPPSILPGDATMWSSPPPSRVGTLECPAPDPRGPTDDAAFIQPCLDSRGRSSRKAELLATT